VAVVILHSMIKDNW